MRKTNLWTLLGKKLNGEANAQEQEKLEELLRGEERGNSHLIEFIEEAWTRMRTSSHPPDKETLDRRWQHLSDRLFVEDNHLLEDYPEERHGPGNRRRLWRYGVAAALAALVAGSLFYEFGGKHVPAPLHEIATRQDDKKHLVLPDGTEVWLNAGSTLSYSAESFPQRDREVRLNGEALFEVAPNALVPFVVRADRVTVRVLGTRFNLRDYKEDDSLQATLISGRVQVSLHDRQQTQILLSPREKLTILKHPPTEDSLALPREIGMLQYQLQTIPLNPVDSTYFAETAWADNKLVFANASFAQVAQRMAKRYQVHFVFEDPELEHVVMNGVFDKETVDQALQLLGMITQFHYRRSTDTIYLNK
jgi:ferric-dicitrate binding protein FerR (iron transport regulator)